MFRQPVEAMLAAQAGDDVKVEQLIKEISGGAKAEDIAAIVVAATRGGHCQLASKLIQEYKIDPTKIAVVEVESYWITWINVNSETQFQDIAIFYDQDKKAQELARDKSTTTATGRKDGGWVERERKVRVLSLLEVVVSTFNEDKMAAKGEFFLRELLKNHKFSQTARNNSLISIVRKAAKARNIESDILHNAFYNSTRDLLENGAIANTTFNDRGLCGYLLPTAANAHPSILDPMVEILLKFGAQVTQGARIESGITPLPTNVPGGYTAIYYAFYFDSLDLGFRLLDEARMKGVLAYVMESAFSAFAHGHKEVDKGIIQRLLAYKAHTPEMCSRVSEWSILMGQLDLAEQLKPYAVQKKSEDSGLQPSTVATEPAKTSHTWSADSSSEKISLEKKDDAIALTIQMPEQKEAITRGNIEKIIRELDDKEAGLRLDSVGNTRSYSRSFFKPVALTMRRYMLEMIEKDFNKAQRIVSAIRDRNFDQLEAVLDERRFARCLGGMTTGREIYNRCKISR